MAVRSVIPIKPIEATPAMRGRGVAWAAPHRYSVDDRARCDDGWNTGHDDDASPLRTEVMTSEVRSILTGNTSPDISFDLSINPYRGCEHGCVYCFARPTHSYLGLSPGIDFETRLVAKVNAPERLRAEFARAGYRPQALNLGSATDAYQPIERRLRITRRLIEVLAEHRHAFSVVTKSAGILRDLDLLAPLAADRLVSVYVSVTTLDRDLARLLEPRAAAPQRRLETIAALAAAGIPVGVSASPMIPFINEPEIERIIAAAAEAGARSAFMVPVRLPWEVAPMFRDWLATHFPERAARVMARIQDLRGGRDNDARFGSRMRGEGVWADLMAQRFGKSVERHGMNRDRIELDLTQFRRPAVVPSARLETAQRSLF